MSFSFRIRFHLPDEFSIGITSSELIIGKYMGSDIILKSKQVDIPIEKAHELILRGDNYSSPEEAWNAGLYCKDVLILAFARLHIGADFGERAPQGGFTTAGIEWLKNKKGLSPEVRVLNDVHGLMVFENDLSIKFVSIHAEPTVVKNKERFIQAVGLALDHSPTLSEQQRLAFDLFGTSFFQKSIDARFLMLMMAVETLLEPASRSAVVQEHVKKLIHLTKASCVLPEKEKDSLIKSLEDLTKESIGQAGRKLAECLGNRRYGGQKPDKFFTACYKLRSKLVHGNVPRPTRDEIASINANLGLFVGDLLSEPLVLT